MYTAKNTKADRQANTNVCTAGEQEQDESAKPLIPWKEYDRKSRAIKSHVNHLITDGLDVWIAFHARLTKGGQYGWFGKDWEIIGTPITHYAEINYPSPTGKYC
ncbi:hypothetical protein [Paenibacillus polymyxa]|uniref:hypothetical protein n=1 Tax=Paenibacillus polymyxa TaxID=1406 RepID=UPI001119E13E|nr:hypothetical protein [Paenibacillus polymyxa]QDA30232.1 hypothetical protein FGY93_25265 [Paenibacillus polymyxa]